MKAIDDLVKSFPPLNIHG